MPTTFPYTLTHPVQCIIMGDASVFYRRCSRKPPRVEQRGGDFVTFTVFLEKGLSSFTPTDNYTALTLFGPKKRGKVEVTRIYRDGTIEHDIEPAL